MTERPPAAHAGDVVDVLDDLAVVEGGEEEADEPGEGGDDARAQRLRRPEVCGLLHRAEDVS